MGMDGVLGKNDLGLRKTSVGAGEKEVGGDREYSKMERLHDMDFALDEAESYFQRNFPGSDMGKRIEAIRNVLNANTIFSDEALRQVKADFQKIQDQFVMVMVNTGYRDSSFKEVFDEIGNELEKVKVRA